MQILHPTQREIKQERLLCLVVSLILLHRPTYIDWRSGLLSMACYDGQHHLSGYAEYVLCGQD
jgi:hypothetical protein